jgi:raffinose/stachyose/melibiose transport system permease protein
MPRSTRAAEAPAPPTASPGGAAAARASRRGRRTQPIAYLYVLPAFLVFAVFLGVPFLQTVQYSFFHWDGLSLATWAGLSNYVDVFTDRELRSAFAHALVLMVFYSVVPITIALFLTALISRANRLRGMSVYRTVLFLPQVIASVVVATIWVSIYSADGLLNSFLRLIGLDSITRVWLGDYDFALIAIGFVGTWLNIGLCLVLFLSGVGNIQPALALTLTLVSALKTFDLVYVTTGGGPGNSTTVPAFEAYNRAFNTGQVGSAAAVAICLTIVIMIVTAVISRLQPRETA